MKVLRIADAIHEQLKKEAKAEGRTLQWVVENKLTGTTPSPKNTEVENLKIGELVRPPETEYHPQKNDRVVAEALGQAEGEPVKNSGELKCCQNTYKPCKHWVWDAENSDGYINSLSGRKMEVEG